MSSRSRTRHRLKWEGTILCLMIMTTWLGSTFLFLRIPYRSNAAVAFRGGGILLLHGRSETGGPMEWTIRTETAFGWGLHQPYSGSATWRAGGRTVLRWYPLWPLVLVVGLPTCLLVWLDRRRRIPPGHCQRCGYDLTGNVSGRCSECGEKVRQ
jgi:hypothetical protein